MTKADLVEKLVERGMARSAAMEAVDIVIETMASALSSGETITLRGLGTFDVRTVKEKKAHDFNNGKTVTIPAHKTVKLVLSKKIKESLKK